MPDAIRTPGGSDRAQPRHRGFVAGGAMLAAPSAAHAEPLIALYPIEAYYDALLRLEQHEIVALALTLGILAFGVVTAILLVRTRRRLAQAEAAAHAEIIELRAGIDRANALLLSERQVLVVWPATDDTAEIVGDPTLVTGGAPPHRLLAFGTWLEAEPASRMEAAVEALRARGESFAASLTTLAGVTLEAEGRVVGGRAILRLRDVSGVKRDLADLAVRHQKLADEVDALRTLVEALPTPIWSRDEAGKLAFANAAYAHAVEVRDGAEAIERGVELFDRAARTELFRAHETEKPYSGRLPAVAAGNRRIFDVLTVPARRGSAGIAIDATDAEAMRAEIRRLVDAHRRTLDQLQTGVAIFDSKQRLTFYNAAYRSLWDLDAGFLDQGPSDSAVLDRLRNARKLPEAENFRNWKTQLHAAYQATEPQEHLWHLPDGRALRVVTTPNPEGGVTYLFHDVTRRLDLERRYDALIRVQGETLDHLAEGVAVFGSDGRLRLHNPVFAGMWKLDPAWLASRPHIEAVIERCTNLDGDNPLWQALRAAVTAIDDRQRVAGRLERRDGSVVDCATMPLPDGATLVTFQDVTDSVNVERALRERNEALEEADEIKIDFVHHVSYELRSPLTNIIGFAHFLGEPSTGPLNEKQREYLGYITVSTNALLAIINNILDLATIDAGAMTLNLGPVDIRRTMEAASEGIQDRLVQNDIRLDIRAAPDIGSFVADERRVRQILFNLLSNAVGFSPSGGTVTLASQRLADKVLFSVTDRGPGIPPEVQDRVFDWFETHTLGSRHRGAGLGLSLVRSFVELHGGTVEIDSAVGQGTTVTCIFPLGRLPERSAA